MRVVAAEYATVDGVMQDPGGVGEIEDGGWSNQYFDDELGKVQSDQLFFTYRSAGEAGDR